MTRSARSASVATAILGAVLALAVCTGRSAAADDAGAWFAFTPPRDSFKASPLDQRTLNETVAGAHGRIAAKGADLVYSDSGEKVRFWGVVIEPWEFPKTHADIDYLSRRLAKLGVNLVRVHLPRGGVPPTHFLDDLHYMVHDFKQQGIYTYFNWYCTAVNGDWTNREYFDPAVQTEYKAWARTLFTTPNPYTGMTLAQDPSIAAVELVDEDSLFFWTFNPARKDLQPSLPLLEAKFGDWLKTKYGSLQKAADAWGPGKYPKGDDFAAGRVAFYNAGTLTGEDWAEAQRNPQRAEDQARFMADTMRTWYADTKKWLHDDLGYGGLVVASNWKTADERVLGPLDQYTNLACDLSARNTYFGGNAQGNRAGYRVDPGQTYHDESLLRHPEQAIFMQIQLAGHPHMMTEGGYAMPNRFRTEEPLLAAGYFSLEGIDGYCPFRLQPDWAGPNEKWPIQTADTICQYPAASIIYRNGYVEEGPVVINDALKLNDLFALKGAAVSQPLGLDPAEAARVPAGARAEVPSLPGTDPLAFYVGRVERTIGTDPGQSSFLNTTGLIDRTHQIVRSATGQLTLDYGRGLFTMNAPCAQGATGSLADAGKIDLADATIQLDDPYGAAVLVSLDGKPLATSGRILLQVMTEEHFTGWQTEPAPAKADAAASADPGNKIVSVGKPPLLVRAVHGQVALKRSDAAALTVTALDANGYPRQKLTGGAQSINLLPDCLYYIIEP